MSADRMQWLQIISEVFFKKNVNLGPRQTSFLGPFQTFKMDLPILW